MLTHSERLRKAIAGEEVDHPAVTAWQHFPCADREAGSLVAATLAFQREFDCDLIKLMPSGMYSVTDYGVIPTPDPDPLLGNHLLREGPVTSPEDWDRLPAIDLTQGALAQELAALTAVCAEVGSDTPVIETLFSPLTMAYKIAGAALVSELLQDEPRADAVLTKLAADVVAFATAALDHGADGFFFASQQASDETPEASNTYARFGTPYDASILATLRDRSAFLLLHLHGPHPQLSLADKVPVDAVSWEDRESGRTLASGLAATSRAVVGGLDRMGVLRTGTPDESERDVLELLKDLPDTRTVIAPGCVMPQDTRRPNLAAAISAVRGGAQ